MVKNKVTPKSQQTTMEEDERCKPFKKRPSSRVVGEPITDGGKPLKRKFDHISTIYDEKRVSALAEESRDIMEDKSKRLFGRHTPDLEAINKKQDEAKANATKFFSTGYPLNVVYKSAMVTATMFLNKQLGHFYVNITFGNMKFPGLSAHFQLSEDLKNVILLRTRSISVTGLQKSDCFLIQKSECFLTAGKNALEVIFKCTNPNVTFEFNIDVEKVVSYFNESKRLQVEIFDHFYSVGYNAHTLKAYKELLSSPF